MNSKILTAFILVFEEIEYLRQQGVQVGLEVAPSRNSTRANEMQTTESDQLPPSLWFKVMLSGFPLLIHAAQTRLAEQRISFDHGGIDTQREWEIDKSLTTGELPENYQENLAGVEDALKEIAGRN